MRAHHTIRATSLVGVALAVVLGAGACSSSGPSSGSSTPPPPASGAYQTLTPAQEASYANAIADMPCDQLAALSDEALTHRDQVAYTAITVQRDRRCRR